MKKVDRDLSSVNDEISRQSNLMSSQQLVVINTEPEDESPGLAGDDEFDRWTEACAKCGQRDQLGEEMICCEQPTVADPNARDAKGLV